MGENNERRSQSIRYDPNIKMIFANDLGDILDICHVPSHCDSDHRDFDSDYPDDIDEFEYDEYGHAIFQF